MITDRVRRTLHDMLTCAHLKLIRRDHAGHLHIGNAPADLLEQLAISVIDHQQWIEWTETGHARPSLIGLAVHTLWTTTPDNGEDGMTLTPDDERELLHLQYDAQIPADLLPGITSSRPLTGLNAEQIEDMARMFIDNVLDNRKDSQ